MLIRERVFKAVRNINMLQQELDLIMQLTTATEWAIYETHDYKKPWLCFMYVKNIDEKTREILQKYCDLKSNAFFHIEVKISS